MRYTNSVPAILLLALASCSSDRTTSTRPCNCGEGGDGGGQAGEASGGSAATSSGGAPTGGTGGSSTGGSEGGEGGAGEGGCADCGGEGGEGAQGGSGGSIAGMSGSAGNPSGAGGIAGSGGKAGAGQGGAMSGSGGLAGGGAGGCLACAGSGGGNAMPVDLQTAGDFAILSKSGVSTVPASSVTGNVGVSPAAATYLTGWSLIADASNQFSTSTQIIGRAYAADMAPPTPSMMTTAIGDMQLAFTDATSRSPGVTELGAGDISGLVIAPGVYAWSSGLLATTDVSLTGNASAIWILQVAQTLTVSNGVNITLSGGALPKNVFWAISESVSIGTSAHVEGIVMTMTSVAMQTGSSINGRLLAQTAVTLDSATVVQPAP